MFRWLKKRCDRRSTPSVSKSSATKNGYNNRSSRNTDLGLDTSIAEPIDHIYKEFENHAICVTPSPFDKANSDFGVAVTQNDKISHQTIYITPAVTEFTKATYHLPCANKRNIKSNKKCRRWLTKHVINQPVSVASSDESLIIPRASSKYVRTNKSSYFNHISGSRAIKQGGHSSGRTKQIYPYLCWSNCTNQHDSICQYTIAKSSSPSSSSLSSSSSSEGTSGFYDQDIVYPGSISCNGGQTPCKTRQRASSVSSDSLFSSDSNTTFTEKTYTSSEQSIQREIIYEFNPRFGFGVNRWYKPQ